MNLRDALNFVYGEGVNWANPIRPYVVSGITQTPYEAYQDLKPEFRRVVDSLIGYEPARNDKRNDNWSHKEIEL